MILKGYRLPSELTQRIKAAKPPWIESESAWVRKLLSDQLDFLERKASGAFKPRQPMQSNPVASQTPLCGFEDDRIIDYSESQI